MPKSKLLNVKDAINIIIKDLSVINSEDVELTNSLGRVNSKPIVSKLNNPPQNVSSMDGYALNSKKKFDNYKVIGESSAGKPYENKILDGETIQIFTGAHLPPGTNSVVILEDTKAEAKNLISLLDKNVCEFQNVRKKGLDFKVGDLILEENKVINSRDISTIAMSGNFWLNVKVKPKIGILSTGNEIEKVGELTNKNKIPSGNNIMLSSMIKIFGGEPRFLPIADDNKKSIIKQIEENEDCDLIVSSGGASIGKYDFLSKLFDKKNMNTRVNFWKIAMRPGKPLIFGRYKKTPILGLPGNPVSAGVCSLIFLQPAIKKMLGIKYFFPQMYKGFTTCPIDKNDQRMDFIRSSLSVNKNNHVTPFIKQDSSMTNLFSKADCLIVREPFDEEKKVGDSIYFIKFPDFF